VISFGRSTISPAPTMTGMRSSGTGEFVFDILLVLFSTFSDLILRRRALARRLEGWATTGASWFETREDALLAMRDHFLLRYQRVHVLDGVDKIFLEFLHHGAGGFHAVDQADALADEIADEIARLRIAGGGRPVD